MYSQMMSNNNQSVIPKAYGANTLEGNWYQDRCVSDFDNSKKKDYSLPNPNQWLYETSSNSYGVNNKEIPSIKKKFALSNDDYIGYQGKSNDMYITVNKNAFDSKYRETFRKTPRDTNYYKNKKEELDKYRDSWTKRDHLFSTSYKEDMYKTFVMSNNKK